MGGGRKEGEGEGGEGRVGKKEVEMGWKEVFIASLLALQDVILVPKKSRSSYTT